MNTFDKNRFIMMFHDSLVNTLFNTNIYFTIDSFKCLKEMNKMKKEKDILEKYKYIKQVFQTYKDVFFIPCFEEVKKKDINIQEIDNIVYSFEKSNSLFDCLKDKVNQRSIALLNYVYDCLSYGRNIDSIYNIVKYLLHMKPKDLSNDKKSPINIIDILFNILVYIASTINKEIHKYSLICRELMYFKSTKNLLLSRLNILYICIYVVCTRNIDKHKIVLRKEKDPHVEYLFVICEKDYNTRNQIEQECNLLHDRIQNSIIKDVKVDKYNNHTINMDIIKKM